MTHHKEEKEKKNEESMNGIKWRGKVEKGEMTTVSCAGVRNGGVLR